MGKLAISMAIFQFANCKRLPEGISSPYVPCSQEPSSSSPNTVLKRLKKKKKHHSNRPIPESPHHHHHHHQSLSCSRLHLLWCPHEHLDFFEIWQKPHGYSGKKKKKKKKKLIKEKTTPKILTFWYILIHFESIDWMSTFSPLPATSMATNQIATPSCSLHWGNLPQLNPCQVVSPTAPRNVQISTLHRNHPQNPFRNRTEPPD